MSIAFHDIQKPNSTGFSLCLDYLQSWSWQLKQWHSWTRMKSRPGNLDVWSISRPHFRLGVTAALLVLLVFSPP